MASPAAGASSSTSRLASADPCVFVFFSCNERRRRILHLHQKRKQQHIVRADQAADDGGDPSGPPPIKQSLLEALDFSEVRSEDDAQLLDDARYATTMGEKMTRQQYAALRRKIGGTYKDFFKDSVEVEGDFVDEGWVDKSCRFCKQDTASEPRSVDKFGRYAHITCLEKSKTANFFTRLFGM